MAHRESASRRRRSGGASLYGWLWRLLPGPPAARVATALLLVAAVVAVLFLVVFPAVEPLLPFDDSAVE
jgi:hypothetical protein